MVYTVSCNVSKKIIVSRCTGHFVGINTDMKLTFVMLVFQLDEVSETLLMQHEDGHNKSICKQQTSINGMHGKGN